MESLINLDGISDVANNVINKISSATSWLITRDIPQKIALNTYIEEIKNGTYDPLTKAAMISSAKKTIQEYMNQANIVQKAIQMLTEEVHTKDVSNDWVADFMDKARLVSDEEFQLMWAKILAGEMENPGSYSLRTLERLKTMSKNEAEIFQKVSRLRFYGGGRCLLFNDNNLLNKYDVTFSDLVKLEECGLINLQTLSLTLSVDEENEENTIYNHSIVGIMHSMSAKKQSIELSVHIFTAPGSELLSALNIVENEKYLIEVLSQIKRNNKKDVSITAHRIEKMDENGLINYNREDLLLEEKPVEEQTQ